MKIPMALGAFARFVCGGLLASASIAASAQTTNCGAADCSAGFDVFLLAGQSNMASRAPIPSPLDDDGKPDPAIWMWDGTRYLQPVEKAALPATSTTRIVQAKDPIIHTEHQQEVKTNADGTTYIKDHFRNDAGMGMSFAKAYLAWSRANGHPNRRVLLVGAAWGGTGFTRNVEGYGYRWQVIDDPTKGGDLYREAIKRANDAITAGRALDDTTAFKGILWHQGEHDIGAKGGADYAGHHMALMKEFRKQIKGATNAPIVVGEMTPCFLERCTPKWAGVSIADRDQVLGYLHGIKTQLARSAWVSSAGLKWNFPPDGHDDSVHFDTASQRELGRRYFAKFWEAYHDLPMPIVDLKSHDGMLFNVGNSIDLDTSFATRRITGNLKVNGNIAAATDARLGNVVRVAADARSLSTLIDGELFNGSYTKMAWVKLAGYGNRNNILSADNPSQAHYLFTPPNTGIFAVGHSSVADKVKLDAKAPTQQALNRWVHVAASYDAQAQNMRLYVNGALVDSSTGIAPATRASGQVTLELPGWGGRPGFALDGSMVSAKVYDSALGDSQIKRIFDFEWLWQKGYGRP